MISARLFFFHQVAANRFDQGGREEEGGLDLTTWQSEHCTPAIICGNVARTFSQHHTLD